MPPLELLCSVRRPNSSEKNRHIPVTAYSMTNRDHISLESGLEHDLLRKVDREPGVLRIVAQPFRLSWLAVPPLNAPKRHTPDLLTVHVDGEVTVWDARAADDIDEDFRMKAELTRRACLAVGWNYQLFLGLEEVERLNFLWLHGYRRRPEWAASFEDRICSEATIDGATLGDLFSLDAGTGELISTVWHLVWRGDILVDLLSPITHQTRVRRRSEGMYG